jgi:hypothetical protein
MVEEKTPTLRCPSQPSVGPSDTILDCPLYDQERLLLVQSISAYRLYTDLPSIIDSVATESLRIFAARVFSIRLGSVGPLDV